LHACLILNQGVIYTDIVPACV